MPEEGEATKKIKISGPELVFGFLLRFANLLIGITVFALLVKFDPEYASTIEKVRAASGFSVSKMIYIVLILRRKATMNKSYLMLVFSSPGSI